MRHHAVRPRTSGRQGAERQGEDMKTLQWWLKLPKIVHKTRLTITSVDNSELTSIMTEIFSADKTGSILSKFYLSLADTKQLIRALQVREAELEGQG